MPSVRFAAAPSLLRPRWLWPRHLYFISGKMSYKDLANQAPLIFLSGTAKIDWTWKMYWKMMTMTKGLRLSSHLMAFSAPSMQRWTAQQARNHKYSTVSAISLHFHVSHISSVTWWRVILDEAHSCKSRTSKTAKAVYALSAKRKWAVTGACSDLVLSPYSDRFCKERQLLIVWRIFIRCCGSLSIIPSDSII
jgi:hypothetical protein